MSRKNWQFEDIILTDEQMERAKALNLKRETVRTRIERFPHLWTVDRAVSTPPITYTSGQWTEEDILEAEANNIPRNTFKIRVKRDWPVELAKTESVNGKGRKRR